MKGKKIWCKMSEFVVHCVKGTGGVLTVVIQTFMGKQLEWNYSAMENPQDKVAKTIKMTSFRQKCVWKEQMKKFHCI